MTAKGSLRVSSSLVKNLRFPVSLWFATLVLFVAADMSFAAPPAGEEIYLELPQAIRATNAWGTARNNLSVEGKPLRIGSVEFPRGIGTHAPAELVFALNENDRWLTLYAGISRDMTEKGSVTVQVWLDGKMTFETGILRVREEPVYVSVPVTGARELRLVGTDACDGLAADHLNLGNLRLSTSATPPQPDGPVATLFTGSAEPPNSPLALWYRHPAKRWLEALPLGNGRLATMVFGGVETERLALNESTFWSGSPDTSHDNPAARSHLAEIRKLLFAGEFREAQSLISKHLLGRQGNYGTHLPVGDLLLQMHHEVAEVHDYRRTLDIEQGLAEVSYTLGGVHFTREVMTSHPDNVIALRLSADKPGQISFDLSFKSANLSGHTESRGTDTLLISEGARENKHSDGKTGVSLAGRIRALPSGGIISAQNQSLKIEGADSVILLIALNTTFNGGRPDTLSERQIDEAVRQGYEPIREAHVLDHQTLFRRVALDLGPSPTPQLPTDERMSRLRQGAIDPALEAQFFQFGRYLLIAGSRPDSPLPTNLQGIWNDNLACNMGWTCDFHLDINTQQNYWPTEVCNLSECHEPLFRLIESLREPGRRTAKNMYGARGWVCHVFTNPWGFTAPGWGLGWGAHPTGGIWIASQFWEHYQFTGDREFLQKRAYPVLKEAAEFFLDYLVEEPKHGWLVTGPSTSPENAFIAPNGQGSFSEYMGPTCDTVLVRDLFQRCREASQTLGIDAEFRQKLAVAQAKLPPLRIGKHGQLMEWLEDFEEAIPNHRHTSHLIALYPSDQITPRTTPELAEAARVTLRRRLSQKDWEDVEWSRGNLINFYARLGDGEAAHQHLLGLLREDTDADLLTFSRGGIAGAPENIFCLDGNSAGAAGMAEMLLQSVGDEIELLPALPKSWPTGSVKGLKARGNLTIDIAWEAGKVKTIRLLSKNPKPQKIRVNGEPKAITPDQQ